MFPFVKDNTLLPLTFGERYQFFDVPGFAQALTELALLPATALKLSNFGRSVAQPGFTPCFFLSVGYFGDALVEFLRDPFWRIFCCSRISSSAKDRSASIFAQPSTMSAIFALEYVQ